jgi:hypothetical protein
VVEDREIKHRMELPLVRTVLSTGVSKASVMKVIEKRLRETGITYIAFYHLSCLGGLHELLYSYWATFAIVIRLCSSSTSN